MSSCPPAHPWRFIRAVALCLALLGLVGCVGAPPGTVSDSLFGYNRTFDTAAGAMADQKMSFSVRDRRHGRLVAELGGDTITATLETLPDGTISVAFRQPNKPVVDPGLLQRVVDAYNERMRQATILPKGLL